MNRITIKLVIFIILIVSVFYHNKLYSKDCYNENFCFATDTIPIIDHKGGGNGGGEDPNSVGIVPIGCALLDSGTDLVFSFYDDLGFLTITVINLSTSETYSRIVDSQVGIEYFPFTGTPGFYCIYIVSSLGQSYYGWFTKDV